MDFTNSFVASEPAHNPAAAGPRVQMPPPATDFFEEIGPQNNAEKMTVGRDSVEPTIALFTSGPNCRLLCCSW